MRILDIKGKPRLQKPIRNLKAKRNAKSDSFAVQKMIFDEKLLIEEVEKTILLSDFLKYLFYLKEKPAKLTATGNLSRKVMREISQFIAIPRHYIEFGWRLNNQQDWPYLDQLDALVEVGGFTLKRKGHKRLSPKGREYLTLLPTIQYGELFVTYWEDLNWGYLFPYGEEKQDHPVRVLYQARANLLAIMRDFKRDNDGWINFFDFAENIREHFDLKLINYLGQDLPHRVSDCLVDVLLEPLLGFGMIEVQGEVFDHHRVNSSKLKAFRVTALGEKMISIIVPDRPVVDFFSAILNFN